MRLNYLLSILFLLSQGTSFAIGGDDIPEKESPFGSPLGCGDDYTNTWAYNHFYMLNTTLFVGDAFDGFDYGLQEESELESTSFTKSAERSSFTQNIKLWQRYTSTEVKADDIYEVIYGNMGIDQSNTDNRSNNNNNNNNNKIIYSDIKIDGFETDNSFINYLQNNNREEDIEYIELARAISPYNTLSTVSNYWEEEKDEAWEKQQYKFYQIVLAKLEEVEDTHIQKRYAFLAIRLAFYVGELDKIKELYNRFFAETQERDLLDYWAMHFLTRTMENSTERAYIASLVFNGAADKRYISLRQFEQAKVFNEVLALAKDDKERAGVWVLHAIQNNGPALEVLQKIHRLNPKHPDLDYLLYREVTKLEDWILTPYYKHWGQLRKTDLDYAKEVLNFIHSLNIPKMDNPLAYTVAVAYLQMILDKTAKAKRGFKKALKLAKGQIAAEQHIKLMLFLLDVKGKASKKLMIPKQYQELLMGTSGGPNPKGYPVANEVSHNLKILHLIMEEYHKGGNRILAPLLSAKIPHPEDYYNAEKYKYIERYGPEQIIALITTIKEAETEDEFNKWLYQSAKLDMDLFNDLLGSAYLRENKLNSALVRFEMVDDSRWGNRDYKYSLDANPFYNNLYKEHGPSRRFDTIRYNKESLTRQLIEYIKMAEDPANPKRDYYYLLVGNCYFNMTKKGNSWIMKYPSRWGGPPSNFTYAEEAYKNAVKYAVTEDFKIAALAIAARMKLYQLEKDCSRVPDRIREKKEYKRFSDSLDQYNPYAVEAKALNAEKLEVLRGTCNTFDEYLLAREAM